MSLWNYKSNLTTIQLRLRWVGTDGSPHATPWQPSKPTLSTMEFKFVQYFIVSQLMLYIYIYRYSIHTHFSESFHLCYPPGNPRVRHRPVSPWPPPHSFQDIALVGWKKRSLVRWKICFFIGKPSENGGFSWDSMGFWYMFMGFNRRCPKFPLVGWLSTEGLWACLAHSHQVMMRDGIPNRPLYFYQKDIVGVSILWMGPSGKQPPKLKNITILHGKTHVISTGPWLQ